MATSQQFYDLQAQRDFNFVATILCLYSFMEAKQFTIVQGHPKHKGCKPVPTSFNESKISKTAPAPKICLKLQLFTVANLVHTLWDLRPTLCTGTHSQLTGGIVQLHSLELWKNNQEVCPTYSKRGQFNRNMKKKSVLKKTENISQTLEYFRPLKSQSLFLLEKGKKKLTFVKICDLPVLPRSVRPVLH